MRKKLLQLFGLTNDGLETEFLPAALEITETPPSPIGRAIIWSITSFVLLAILWACLGKTDVVAVAQGRIIPSEQVKTIQPLEIGVVKRIAVEEGQHVNKGDLLMEMDTTTSQADIERLEQYLLETQYETSRVHALLQWNPETKDTAVFVSPDKDKALSDLYAQRVAQEASGIYAQLTSMKSDIERLTAQYNATNHRVLKLKETLPIVTKRSASLKKLYDEKMASEYDWLMREQERIAVDQDLSAEMERLHEALASIQSYKDRKLQVLAEFRRDLLRQESENKARAQQLQKELVKARQRNTLQRIEAPVSGTVQQLAIHTVGGVVKEAQPVMVVVPEDCTLEIEAHVLNKDIGFINAGQPVEIKIESFPYTEYGIINGNVKHISNDAVPDETKGMIYLARISMDKNYIHAGNKKIPLSPGMNAFAEIKIRKRRLIEYFLSPLLKYSQESLRER